MHSLMLDMCPGSGWEQEARAEQERSMWEILLVPTWIWEQWGPLDSNSRAEMHLGHNQGSGSDLELWRKLQDQNPLGGRSSGMDCKYLKVLQPLDFNPVSGGPDILGPVESTMDDEIMHVPFYFSSFVDSCIKRGFPGNEPLIDYHHRQQYHCQPKRQPFYNRAPPSVCQETPYGRVSQDTNLRNLIHANQTTIMHLYALHEPSGHTPSSQCPNKMKHAQFQADDDLLHLCDT
ncbi:hypothetical protein IEQ34_007894 [Dendrobium chrysotoxum]|uniref:Uncharacterized protein n=1 Tax=Dendrobium chrysotoxum TaxID=161865 RepID=A0AAV7H4R0_DENCH|nr:hypothetical protein IEQ34_007894 [Dendrobium chrysotoxum]